MIDASRRVPQVLVLVPTRELAVQVSEAMFTLRPRTRRQGGARLRRPADPTPAPSARPRRPRRGGHAGRALDHIGRGSLALDSIQTVILDEADEMLDMGFTDDIESILESTPDDRQTVLFSATMPSRITSIAKRYQRNPERITIGRPDAEPGAKALVRQTVYVVQRAHKPSALGRILDIEAPKSALVFCRTRTEVDQLTETMNARGYRAEALHGGMDQAQRDRVMARLRDGTAELLVATDVAARGLDVDTLTHVVNYDVPSARRATCTASAGRPRRARRRGDHPGRTARATRRSAGSPTTTSRSPRRAHPVSRAGSSQRPGERGGDRRQGGRGAGGAPPAARLTDGERIFVGAGRQSNVRPNDLVGAIANESSLRGRDIGAIEIFEKFSLVEVPADKVDEVISALRRTTLRGRRPSVRRDRA
jgi:ATP-dependent RNA helicase DeaD